LSVVTVVKDDYLDVAAAPASKEDGRDLKSDSPKQQSYTAAEWKSKMRVVHVARPVGRRGGLGKLSETRVTLTQDLSGQSAANTALALVINMTPFTCNDWTAYASLYDEVKVHAVTVLGTYSYATYSTALNARTIVAWAYDPIDATAPASVVDSLSASQHAGPWVVSSPYLQAATYSANQGTPTEVSTTRGGFHRHTFVVPKGHARSSANASTFGDEWADTADSGDYWGFVKMYIEAGGTAGVIGYRHFTFYDVSFRSRH
jgi:hypothetical protein